MELELKNFYYAPKLMVAFGQLILDNKEMFDKIGEISEYNNILSMEAKFEHHLILKKENISIIKIEYHKDGRSRGHSPGPLKVIQLNSASIPGKRCQRKFTVQNWNDALIICYQHLLFHSLIESEEDVKLLTFELVEVKREPKKEPEFDNFPF